MEPFLLDDSVPMESGLQVELSSEPFYGIQTSLPHPYLATALSLMPEADCPSPH